MRCSRTCTESASWAGATRRLVPIATTSDSPAFDGRATQSRDGDQVHDLGRRLAIAVGELIPHLVDLPVRRGRRRRGRQLLVGLEPQPLALDVFLGDVRIHRQLEPQLGLAFGDIATERGDGLADHPQVEVEADSRDVSGLFAAEQVAGSANLEVFERDLDARPEVVVRSDGRQPVERRLGQRLVFVVQEVGVGPLATSTDATAQLVQLREPVLVGAIDDERVRVGDVEAGLDDGGRDEHVELALPEVDHDLLEHVLGQLAVGDGDARLGHDLGDLRRDAVDG